MGADTLKSETLDAPSNADDRLLALALKGDRQAIERVTAWYRPKLTEAEHQRLVERFISAATKESA
jgi:hypothetical protein